MIGKVLKVLLDAHGHLEIDGLGIFKTEYQGSVIQFSTQTISPPANLVYFEGRPVPQTSPTLVQYLQQEIGLSESQTFEYLAHFVQNVLFELNSLGKAEISGFGQLAKDIEGNIFFRALPGDSMRMDSFGLHALSSQPVYTKQKQTTEREAPVIPLHPFDAEIRSTRELEQTPGRRVKFWAVGMVAAAMSLAIISMFLVGKRASVMDYTGTVVRQDAALVPLQSPTSKPVESYSPTASTENKKDNNPEIAAIPSPTENEKKNTTQNTNSVAAHSEEPQYHVIAGSFIMDDKCRQFNQSIKKLGLDGHILPKNEKGLHRISIGKFTSKENALSFLLQQQSKFEDQLWILTE